MPRRTIANSRRGLPIGEHAFGDDSLTSARLFKRFMFCPFTPPHRTRSASYRGRASRSCSHTRRKEGLPSELRRCGVSLSYCVISEEVEWIVESCKQRFNGEREVFAQRSHHLDGQLPFLLRVWAGSN